MACTTCGTAKSNIRYQTTNPDGTTTIHETRGEAEAVRVKGGKITRVLVRS